MSALGVVTLVLGVLILVGVVVVPVARRARRVGSELEAQLGPAERAENVRGRVAGGARATGRPGG